MYGVQLTSLQLTEHLWSARPRNRERPQRAKVRVLVRPPPGRLRELAASLYSGVQARSGRFVWRLELRRGVESAVARCRWSHGDFEVCQLESTKGERPLSENVDVTDDGPCARTLSAAPVMPAARRVAAKGPLCRACLSHRTHVDVRVNGCLSTTTTSHEFPPLAYGLEDDRSVGILLVRASQREGSCSGLAGASAGAAVVEKWLHAGHSECRRRSRGSWWDSFRVREG